MKFGPVTGRQKNPYHTIARKLLSCSEFYTLFLPLYLAPSGGTVLPAIELGSLCRDTMEHVKSGPKGTCVEHAAESWDSCFSYTSASVSTGCLACFTLCKKINSALKSAPPPLSVSKPLVSKTCLLP